MLLQGAYSSARSWCAAKRPARLTGGALWVFCSPWAPVLPPSPELSFELLLLFSFELELLLSFEFEFELLFESEFWLLLSFELLFEFELSFSFPAPWVFWSPSAPVFSPLPEEEAAGGAEADEMAGSVEAEPVGVAEAPEVPVAPEAPEAPEAGGAEPEVMAGSELVEPAPAPPVGVAELPAETPV